MPSMKEVFKSRSSRPEDILPSGIDTADYEAVEELLHNAGFETSGGQIIHFWDPDHWEKIDGKNKPLDVDALEDGEYTGDELVLKAKSQKAKALVKLVKSDPANCVNGVDHASANDLWELVRAGKVPGIPKNADPEGILDRVGNIPDLE